MAYESEEERERQLQIDGQEEAQINKPDDIKVGPKIVEEHLYSSVSEEELNDAIDDVVSDEEEDPCALEN